MKKRVIGLIAIFWAMLGLTSCWNPFNNSSSSSEDSNIITTNTYNFTNEGILEIRIPDVKFPSGSDGQAFYFNLLGKEWRIDGSYRNNLEFNNDERCYHLDTDINKSIPLLENGVIYETDLYCYWASYNNYSWEPDVKNIKYNGTYKISFVKDENDVFYTNIGEYFKGKVESLSTLYPLEKNYVQYSDFIDNKFVINLKDGTKRYMDLPADFLAQIDLETSGTHSINYQFGDIYYNAVYNVTPIVGTTNQSSGITTVTDIEFNDELEQICFNLPSSYEVDKSVLNKCRNVKKLTVNFELEANDLENYTALEDLSLKNTKTAVKLLFGTSLPEALKAIRILEGEDTLRSYFFYGCSQIDDVYLPYTIATLEDNCFKGLNLKLQNLIYPGQVSLPSDIEIETLIVAPKSTSICNYYCYTNKYIKKVIMPDSVKTIGVDAFANCYSLEDIVFSNNLTYLYHDAFTATAFTKLKFPNSLQTVAFSCFSECTQLKEIDFGEGILSIETSQFINCRNLETFICKSLNAQISVSGLLHDTNVSTIHINGKQKITDIYYKKGDTIDIFPLVNLYVYGDIGKDFCKGMKHAGSNKLHSVYLRLDASVTSIGESAFEGTDVFKSVELKNVKTIGVNAFKDSRFDTIFQSGNLEWIYNDAFYNSDYFNNNSKIMIDNILIKQLEDDNGNIEIDNNVKTIINYAFASANAKNIIVPSSVEIIDSASFSTNATTITIKGKLSLKNGGKAFALALNLEKIYIPLELVSYYTTTDGFKEYSSLYQVIDE